MVADSNTQRPTPKRALIITLFVAAALILLYLAWHLSQMLLVAFAAIMLAVFLDGVTEWLGRYIRLPRTVALPLVIAAMLLFLAAAAYVVGPRVMEQFAKLSEKIPEALQDLQASIAGSEWGSKILPESPTAKDLLPMSSDLIGRVTGVFSSALGIVTNALIIFFVGVYLAVSPRLYISNVIHLFPKQHRQRAEEVFTSIGRALRWWLLGRFAAMLATGSMVALGLWIAGIPLALSLGLIAALLSFIPFIGPILSAIPMILVALAEDPVLVIYAVIVYLIAQTLESYLVTPMIQRQVVFIPPALLITVQIFMSVMFGVMGMLMATPLALVAIVMVQMLYVEDVLGDEARIMGQH